jgi:hypothetical protein
MEGVYVIDVDLETGEAYIGLRNKSMYFEIVKLDSGCSEIIDRSVVPIQDDPTGLIIDQGRQGILPFSIEKIQGIQTQSEPPVPSNGITNQEFVDNFFEEDPQELIADMSESEDDIGVKSPNSKIQVWVDDKAGIHSVKLGSLPGLAFESSRNVKNVIRLPSFSWLSNSVKGGEVLYIGRDSGKVDKYSIDQTLTRNTGSLLLLESLDPRLSPIGAHGITGIASNPSSQNVFVSSENGTMLIDASTLKPLAYAATPLDFIASLQEPKNILWGISQKDGKMFKIERSDIESESTESTNILTTSSSWSSLSSVSSRSSSYSSQSSFSSSTRHMSTSSISLTSQSSSKSSSLSSISNLSSESSNTPIAGSTWSLAGNTYVGRTFIVDFSMTQPTIKNTDNGKIYLSVSVQRQTYGAGRLLYRVYINGYRDLSLTEQVMQGYGFFEMAIADEYNLSNYPPINLSILPFYNPELDVFSNVSYRPIGYSFNAIVATASYS